MQERPFGEIVDSPEHKNRFLAVRVDEQSGQKMGTIISVADDPDEVHAAIRKDRMDKSESVLYLMFVPQKLGEKDRQSWAIGGNL